MPSRQLRPAEAPDGHMSAQTRHSPQRLSSIGSPTGRGASVSTLANRCAPPNSGVISSAIFPIHPSPARVATVLCCTRTERVLSSMPPVEGQASAR